ELWGEPPPALSDLEAALASSTVGLGTGVDLAAIYSEWPRYPEDAYVGKWASTTIPMLMIEGSLDFIPAASTLAVKEHFSAAHQTFELLPGAPHGALVGSPTNGGGLPCGAKLMLDFVKDPTSPVDASCVGAIQALDFHDLAPGDTQYYFGTPDLWEGDPGPTP